MGTRAQVKIFTAEGDLILIAGRWGSARNANKETRREAGGGGEEEAAATEGSPAGTDAHCPEFLQHQH